MGIKKRFALSGLLKNKKLSPLMNKVVYLAEQKVVSLQGTES
jgi:hypothetical protein